MSNDIDKRLAKLEHEVIRLKSVNEIQNLMGKYESIHNETDVNKSWELFAQHTPDTWMEISNWGMFEGIEEIKRVWMEMGHPPSPGAMFEHPLSTPIIVVARDGQTARCTWQSMGHETGVGENGKAEASWCYGKYAIDFIKEDGQWKIWHFKWFRYFITPFDVPWTERIERPRRPREYGKPSRYHKPYTKDSIQITIPPVPEPFETYADDLRYWMFKTDAKL